MAAKRVAKVSNSQREKMLDYFEMHPELVSGRFTATFTKQVHDKLWEELKIQLNSEGSGAVKDVPKWKKVIIIILNKSILAKKCSLLNELLGLPLKELLGLPLFRFLMFILVVSLSVGLAGKAIRKPKYQMVKRR